MLEIVREKPENVVSLNIPSLILSIILAQLDYMVKFMER